MDFKRIQDQFVNEARLAPNLFADLAKVELYISESYRTRAFAELLQNADDAKSTNFVAIYYNEKLYVGNNGAIFTEEDLIALCRSGSSNKKRDGNTIGYRGIGFKSVAGIAEEICVISGDLCFKFSKKETQKVASFICQFTLSESRTPFL
ncbi:MAG: ATP-binding protein, partial [Desulfamplus sp.]|nr:ATP-binding protein [Desulfamplus sp.]